MVAIKLPIFSGMVPSIDPHLLADQNASFAQNAWLYSGALSGLPKMAELHTLANPQATIAFRIPGNEADPTYLYNSTWMEFENVNTDFISAPVADDMHKRFYWASTSTPPMYNTLDRIRNGQPAWLLGVPQPGNLTVNAAGGSSSTTVSRAYVATLVTAYGEEGPTSNPVLINGKVDDTYTVTIPAVPAADLGVQRNITKIRLYRTITSAAGTATYYQVAELNALATTQTYDDTMSDATLASNPILESTAWTAPPDLEGICTMPNGIVAGFKKNELYFSEAYRPHAWPAAYALTLEHDIVGLAVVSQTLVVCTKGNPYTASGVNPASITTSMLAAFEPCLTKGSILPTEAGVYYTSPNGLILVNAGFAQNVTQQFISRDKWNELANRAKINAGRLGTAFYAFGMGVQRIAQDNFIQQNMVQQESNDGASDGFLIDPTNTNVGMVVLRSPSNVKSVRNDIFSGEMLVVMDGKVYWLDQRPGYEIDPYIWRSKVFQTPYMKNFAAFKVYFYEPEGIIEFPNPPNFDPNQEFDPATQLAVVRVFADNRIILTHELRKSGELHRLPSGFKADFWQIEIEARVPIKSFQMATSVKELQFV